MKNSESIPETRVSIIPFSNESAFLLSFLSTGFYTPAKLILLTVYDASESPVAPTDPVISVAVKYGTEEYKQEV